MKTTRIREKIKNFLGDRPRNTAEILEHINSTMRHGTTSQQLGAVLEKDKDIVKVGYIKKTGILSGGYDICEWATRTWISSNCPGWQEGTPILIGGDGKVIIGDSSEDDTKYDYDFPGNRVSFEINKSKKIRRYEKFELIGFKPAWVESWNAILAFSPSVIQDRTFKEYFDLRGKEYDVVTELDKYKFVSKLGDYCVYKNTIPSEIPDRDKFNESKRLLMAVKCYTWTIDCIRESNQSEKYALLGVMIRNNLGLTYIILKQFAKAEICFLDAKSMIQYLVYDKKITPGAGLDLFKLIEDNQQLSQEKREHNNRPRSELSYLVDEFELDF